MRASLIVLLSAALAAPMALAQDEEEAPPAEAPAAEEAPESDEIDLEALRKEYMALRDQLFRSRARAAAVGDSMYSSKIVVRLHYGSGRFYTVSRATIRLDGANIFDDIEGAVAADKAPRFEGFVAPGRHVVGVRIEAAGKDDDRFTSVIDNSFVVEAVAGKDLIVDITAADDGDLPYKWQRKQRGSYRLHLDVDVTTAERRASK